jgi:hypothetical protein
MPMRADSLIRAREASGPHAMQQVHAKPAAAADGDALRHAKRGSGRNA